jgi:hypothetical protein
MTHDEIIYELKRLLDLLEETEYELADEIRMLISTYEKPRGECCG